jgi:purine-binding chemotaxis protein CheW
MSDLLVLAKIGGRNCAFAADDVQSVVDIGAITPIPRSPDYVIGLSALRSQTLTVLDCRKAIGLSVDQKTTDARAAVVRVDGHTYALLVDAIDDVATVRGEPGEIPGGFGEEWNRVARGMAETDRGPVLLVDIAALITGPAQDEVAA